MSLLDNCVTVFINIVFLIYNVGIVLLIEIMLAKKRSTPIFTLVFVNSVICSQLNGF